MTKEEFKVMWKKWLIEIGKSETELCREQGLKQQTFNAKTRNATIKYIELDKIVSRYGYTIEIRKKQNNLKNTVDNMLKYVII